MKQTLPNAVAVLVLGILGLAASPFCFGMILSIVALAIANKPTRLYKENPDLWDGYGMVNAGRICALIALIINVLSIIVAILLIILGVISSELNMINTSDISTMYL